MTTKTLYLEASREGDKLKIGIHEQQDSKLAPSIDPYEVKEISIEKMEDIEKNCLETVNLINHRGKEEDINGRLAESLKKMGEFLCDELLTPQVKQRLLLSDAMELLLRIDDKMVQIPWELMCLNGEFLCERFNVGRLVRTRQKIGGIKTKGVSFPINMWVLTNPSRDLPSTDEEGKIILRITDGINPEDSTLINASLDSANVSVEKISSKIKNSDLVHFAGHAEYHTGNTAQSGWKISDGYFSTQNIDKMAGSSKMPTLVFSNACHSARSDEWLPENDSFGLANAFLRAGVKYYIGTFWEIMDIPGTLFASEFYQHLFTGKTIGESVRLARIKIREEYSDDYVGWAGYLLYGDPRFRLFDVAHPSRPSIPDTITPIQLESVIQDSARGGSKANYTKSKLNDYSNRSKSLLFVAVSATLICFAILGAGFFFKGFDYLYKKDKQNIIYKERDRKDFLVDKINKQTTTDDLQTPAAVDNRLETTNIAIVFDPFNPKDPVIASAIKKEIRNRKLKVKFVERESLNTLLEEINLALSLPSENRPKLNFIATDLVFLVNTKTSVTGTVLDFKILDTGNCENLYQATSRIRKKSKIPDTLMRNIVTIIANREEKKSDR